MILNDHESGANAAVRCQECRQFTICRVDQTFNTSLRYVSQLRNCDSQEVKAQCHRLSVEVTAGDSVLIFFEDDRIICYRVYFNIYMVKYIIHCILAGAVDLR